MIDTNTITFETFTTAPRTDVHRPSAINPAEYEFVCVNYTPGANEGELGELEFLAEQRAAREAHMARTGGTWSNHQHGGNCHVCGAHAMYTVTFYHTRTNAYIRTGFDCADKMEMGDADLFRTYSKLTGLVKDARELIKGKKKALALLTDAGLLAAWEMWNAPQAANMSSQEEIVHGMVHRLVKYGSISDKALDFMRTLLTQIANRPAVEAAKAAEKAAAADCPTGRLVITGEVISMKRVDTRFGETLKMLVKHSTGFKVWGTVPTNLQVTRGAVVEFTALVEPSPDDRTFGFYTRPTKARVVQEATA